MLTIYEKKEFKPAQTANVLDTTEIVPVQFTTIMGNKKPMIDGVLNSVWGRFRINISPGAIIGDGDRKRTLFLVLGLSPWYRTIFLFLAQIAPSPLAHALIYCEDFCGCHPGKMTSKLPEIFYAFGPQLNACMSGGILLKYFLPKFLQFEWSKTVSNLGMSSFILRCCVPLLLRTSHYSTLNFIYVKD